MKTNKDGFELTQTEKAAFDEAHKTVKNRFAAARVEYDEKLDEAVRYWLYGALYIGGIACMMRCAVETPIKPKGESI